jgi:hypothetical protein
VNVAPETGIETVIVAGLGPVKDVGTDPVNVEPDAVKVVPVMGRDPVKIAENGEDAAEFVQITPKATVEPVAGPVDNSPVAKTVVAPGPDMPKPVAHEPVAREVAAPEPVASASVAREVDREVADRKSVQRDDAPVVAEVRAPVDSLVAAQSAGIAVAVPEDVAASARTLAIAQAVDKIVEAVSAQIEIRPSLVNGEGEIVIRLKPTVLDGSEIKLAAKDGILSMEITPATPQAEQVVARSVPQLERALAEHIPAFHGFTVAVRSRGEERKDR